MDRSLLKTVTLCLVVATFLVGCGVKPTLNGLEVPEKSKSVAREIPADADTIDGTRRMLIRLTVMLMNKNRFQKAKKSAALF